MLSESLSLPIRLREYIKKQQEEESMAGILTALLSGALMSIQGVSNTEVTKTDEYMAGGRLGAD